MKMPALKELFHLYINIKEILNSLVGSYIYSVTFHVVLGIVLLHYNFYFIGVLLL